MSLQKLMKNLIVALYVILMAAFVTMQTLSGSYNLGGKTIKYIPTVTIIFTVAAVVIIALYLILRAFLNAKNLSKMKKQVIEIAYIVVSFISTRIIFGALFLNSKVGLNELMSMNKELTLLDSVGSFIAEFVIKIADKVFNFPMLTIFIFNSVIFLIATFLMRNILKNVTHNNFFINLGTFIYILYPKNLYYSMSINCEILNNLYLLLVLVIIFAVLKEIKIIHNKSKKYLIYSVLLGIVFASMTYTVNYMPVWILVLIVINIVIKNIDIVHIKFSKQTLQRVSSVERAKLYKIEKIYIKKFVIGIFACVISLMLAKVVLDTTSGLIAKKNFHGYRYQEITSLFGSITETMAREQMRDINFKTNKEDTKTINYNIGKSVVDIMDLSQKGKLKEASNLAESLKKVVNRPLSFKEKIVNNLNKTAFVYKDDINEKSTIYKKVRNKEELISLMITSNVIYKTIFVVIMITEALHIILRRKRSEKTVIIRIVTMAAILISYLYSSYSSANVTVTTLSIILMCANILEIYKNREGKIKALSEAKYRF